MRGFPPNMVPNPITGGLMPNPGGTNGPVTGVPQPLRLGNSVTLTKAPMQNKQAVIAPVTCHPQSSPNLVVSMGASEIVFGPVPPPPGTEFAAFLLATISFGLAGAKQVVEVDIKTGVQLSLMADALEITAEILRPESSNSPNSVKVTAAVGDGSRAARSFPTRTYPTQEIADGGAFPFPVPPFAYSLMLYGDPAIFVPGGGGIVVTGSDKTAGYSGGVLLLQEQTSVFNNANLTDGLKLPNGSGVVFVQNTSGAPVKVTPVFGLSL